MTFIGNCVCGRKIYVQDNSPTSNLDQFTDGWDNVSTKIKNTGKPKPKPKPQVSFPGLDPLAKLDPLNDSWDITPQQTPKQKPKQKSKQIVHPSLVEDDDGWDVNPMTTTVKTKSQTQTPLSFQNSYVKWGKQTYASNPTKASDKPYRMPSNWVQQMNKKSEW